MLDIYLKEKDNQGITRFKRYIHIDDVARVLKIKPATFASYLSRSQISIKPKKIKTLTFFSADDIDIENGKLIQNSDIGLKGAKSNGKHWSTPNMAKVASKRINTSRIAEYKD